MRIVEEYINENERIIAHFFIWLEHKDNKIYYDFTLKTYEGLKKHNPLVTFRQFVSRWKMMPKTHKIFFGY